MGGSPFENRRMTADARFLEVRREKAARLLEIRQKLRLSQRAVAQIAGISQALYNELERSKRDLLPRHIEMLSRSMGDEVRKLM